ncbi:hypothetical protein MVES1_003227 [Malassezia vespertilionis]|uniref:Amino acid transporter transmembrane domain-containing protein n=1 Tax=Malassezia vespertilionis TaxID=2020962 RepID=A0A2N1J9K5_9BASI|nr:uncharacterized protein MVES1_003227 [Malassezia vespertilionis]PKI83237.1 hypothetical protein MVES_003067 [Malassezia vespertilionis]WFD07859.1 hypothetical protein MVES1_003227 [Malassezia vespertilionis]
MDQLAPRAEPGSKPTFLSRIFPHSDLAIARRAKYLDEADQRGICGHAAPAGKNDLDKDGSMHSDPAASRFVKMEEDTQIIEQINGVYLAEDIVALPRTLGSIGAFWNMIAYSIALGIFSIPMTVATIGVVPFMLINVFFACLTYYIGYNYWRIAMMYPGVHSLQQVGDLIFGRWGAYSFTTIQTIFGIFLQGNHALLGGIAFNNLGWHSCMVILVFVFSVISFIFTLPRSYKVFAWQAAISFTSIFTVVIIAMIASGVTEPQNMGPGDPPKRILAFGSTDQVPHKFLDGVMAVTNIFVSYGATPAYLPVMAEMSDPRLFIRSLSILVVTSFVLYSIVGCVINYNLGQYTKSPSLGSLSSIMIKITYGLGLPTILVAGCASGQVVGKVLFRNVFNGARKRYLKNPVINWGVWVGINVVTWVIAFVLAEVIPFFSSFLGLESSLFWAFFLCLAPIFYLWRHQHDYWDTWRNRLGFIVALGIIGVSGFLCIAGVWASVVSIRDQYNSGAVGSPFSCASAN